MESQPVWLVSDDLHLLASFEYAIAKSYDAPTLRISPTSFMSLDGPVETPLCVLIDVRGFDDWNRLESACIQWSRRANGYPTAYLAIVDQSGFPLEAVATADAIFTDSVEYPYGDIDFYQLLHQAATAEDESLYQRSTEVRTLECRGRKFVTRTPALYRLFNDLELASSHCVSLLLIGETGSGKTSIAQLIHEISPRREGPFVPVACGALPRDLIDSELFGHIKGAFTGASGNKIGKFEAAQGGTMLLDEIDVLTLEQQVKLLRILESGEYEKLGSHEPQTADARVVVASNECLEALVDQGRFRADLFFRLNQVKFEIPPLRERPRDVVPLALEILRELMSEHNFGVRSVHPEYLELLKYYDWPGNIRELRNEIRRAALFCREGVVTIECLTPSVRQRAMEMRSRRCGPEATTDLSNQLAKTEQLAIEEMLQTQKYNRTATAKALGISRVTLYNKLRKYGIQVKGK